MIRWSDYQYEKSRFLLVTHANDIFISFALVVRRHVLIYTDNVYRYPPVISKVENVSAAESWASLNLSATDQLSSTPSTRLPSRYRKNHQRSILLWYHYGCSSVDSRCGYASQSDAIHLHEWIDPDTIRCSEDSNRRRLSAGIEEEETVLPSAQTTTSEEILRQRAYLYNPNLQKPTFPETVMPLPDHHWGSILVSTSSSRYTLLRLWYDCFLEKVILLRKIKPKVFLYLAHTRSILTSTSQTQHKQILFTERNIGTWSWCHLSISYGWTRVVFTRLSS